MSTSASSARSRSWGKRRVRRGLRDWSAGAAGRRSVALACEAWRGSLERRNAARLRPVQGLTTEHLDAVLKPCTGSKQRQYSTLQSRAHGTIQPTRQPPAAPHPGRFHPAGGHVPSGGGGGRGGLWQARRLERADAGLALRAAKRGRRAAAAARAGRALAVRLAACAELAACRARAHALLQRHARRRQHLRAAERQHLPVRPRAERAEGVGVARLRGGHTVARRARGHGGPARRPAAGHRRPPRPPSSPPQPSPPHPPFTTHHSPLTLATHPHHSPLTTEPSP